MLLTGLGAWSLVGSDVTTGKAVSVVVVGSGDATEGALGGLPLLGLEASRLSSRLLAGLQSAHDLNSLRSSPLLVRPALITRVLLVGLSKILNGPL